MTDLADTLTIVTGGGQGVGLALASEAARRGSRVVIGSISDASHAVAKLTADGAVADWFEVDVSDADQVQAFAAYVRANHGSANVVINNAAGGGAQGSLFQTDAAAIRRTLEINILGYIWVLRAFEPDLVASAKAAAPAHVLNVGSEHALGVPPYVTPLSAYTVSKQADLAISETARRDLEGTGVKVSFLAPGWVLTETVTAFMEQSDEFRSAVEPYAQEAAHVARVALDALLEGRELIVTNPKSVPFARARAAGILTELERAETAGGAAHGHGSGGDIND